jgi:hypothetical protein
MLKIVVQKCRYINFPYADCCGAHIWSVVLNLVTPKAAAKLELWLEKPL